MAYNPIPPLGQAAMAASLPVVVSSDQSAVAVSGTITANIGTVGTLATAAKQDTGNTSLGTIAGAVSGTEMQVDVLTMPTVTVTASNLDVQSGGADLATSTQAGAIQTATELIDDAVFVDDADWTDNTSKHINVGGVYQSAPHTVTDGDVTPFLTDVNGRQVVTGTVAVTQSGAWDEVGINDSGNSITVDNPQLSVVGSGTEAAAMRVTIATDSTGVLSVDDNGASLTVDNAGLTELAAAINGSSQMDVNIAASAISFGGTSAADDADFSVGTTPGTPAMGVYDSTPDTVTDGDLGVIGINSTRAVRTVIEAGSASIGVVDLGATDNAVLDAIAASVASSDTSLNDIEAALETAGGLVVNLGANNDVTVTGTVDLGATDNAVLDDIAAKLGTIDNPIQVLGTDTYTEATSSGITIGAVRRDADTTLVGTTNEFGPLQMDANGRLKVEAFSGEALPVTLTSTTVTGTVAVTQSGTWDEVGINDSGNSITVDAPVGTPVNVQIGNATLSAGVIDETGASAVDALAVGGGTPHDAVDSGNPIKMGWKASNALPTAVANADRANGISDLWGRQLVSHIDPAMQVNKTVNVTTTQTGTDVWSPTAGKKIAVTSYTISAYGTTAGRVILWFGDNADTTYTAGTDQVLGIFSFAPSSTQKPGAVVTLPTPIFCTTADRELHLTTDAGISLDITVYGYER